MKKNKRPKHRLRLSLYISIFVFCVILIAILVSFGLANLLAYTGIIISIDEKTDTVTLFVFMGVVSLIVGLIIALLSGIIPIKPMSALINRINRLASGDFKVRLNPGRLVRSVPALDEAVASFNKMAEELENTQMLRSDFINNFSHEFKTPIVSIAGFAKLLKKGNLTEEEKTEYLDIIETESLRLSTMATNVLNLTKVENQAILTEITEFNLSEQLRNSILLLEPKWSKKDIEFDLRFDEYTVRGNEELLKQVWINLIDNAIKFSDKTIGIMINEEETHTTVSVLNTGSHIPKEKISKIFDKFYQADESHSGDGNGIGLALAKRIVDLHCGKITVESENNTVTFKVALPKEGTAKRHELNG